MAKCGSFDCISEYLKNGDSYGDAGNDERVVFDQLDNAFEAAVDLLQGERRSPKKMSVGANGGYLWAGEDLLSYRICCLDYGAWRCSVATLLWINSIAGDKGRVSEVAVACESTALQLE